MTSYILVVLFIIIFLAITIVFSRNGRNRIDYDERQELIRGRGYKYAMITVVAAVLLGGLMFSITDRLPFDAPFFMLTAGLLALCVDVIYCILKGAYFGIQNQYSKTIIPMVILGVCNLVSGVAELQDTGFAGGRLTVRNINIVIGILFLMIPLIAFARMRADKEDDAE